MAFLWILFIFPKTNLGWVPFQIIIYFLIFALITTSLIDLDWKIVPDEVTVPLGILGILVSPFNPFLILPTNGIFIGIQNSLLGGIFGGGLIYTVSIVGKFIFKKDVMGWGDIKLLASYGTILGMGGILLNLLLRCYSGGFSGRWRIDIRKI